MTPDEILREMWETCDSGGLMISTDVDQWWTLTVWCGHGKFRGVSNGPVDISTAFTRALEKFRGSHPCQ